MTAPHDSPRQPLNEARKALAAAQEQRARLVDELARRRRERDHLARLHGPDDDRTQAAAAGYSEVLGGLVSARERERAAKDALAEGLGVFLPPDPAEEIARLPADVPIVLFPVRLETRFVHGGRDDRGAGDLLVRLYPDSITAHSHEPRLTEEEVAAGQQYWRTAWDHADEADAWTALLAATHATRAAWIVQQTAPTNLDQFPTAPGGGGPAPAFPAVETRPPNWHTAPASRVLPDRWLILAYRGGEIVRQAVSGPVQEPLALTLALSADGDDPALDDSVDLSGDGLNVDPEILWTFDFEQAEQVGMAVRLPLSADDFGAGFDLILALGVKSSLGPDESAERLADLIAGHHYTRGLAFVPQGTPTNNTGGEPSGFPPPDPRGAHSFATERGDPLAGGDGHGARFMTALGLPPALADHIAGADRDEDSLAAAMAEALWPTTIGYFLEQMMAPDFPRGDIDAVREHLVQHVRGRGPFPAFRVGDVPYGLLPVSTLDGWEPLPRADDLGGTHAVFRLSADRSHRIDVGLPPVLRRAWNIWRGAIASAPHVTRTGDPDADLLETLGMDASTREVRIRATLGRETQVNMLGFLGLNWNIWDDIQRAIARSTLGLLGLPEWDPRFLWLNFADDAPLFRHGLVTGDPLSESEGLAFDYIHWIRTASLAALRNETFPDGVERPGALLYLMLRHAHLTHFAQTAHAILLDRKLIDQHATREREMIGVVPEPEARLTIWQQFDQPVAGLTGSATLGEFLTTVRDSPVVVQDLTLASYRNALERLEGLPTAELDRLFTETLDVCAHRLDAWITSLASKRLERMRRARPAGSFLGAYGWVENLRPDPPTRRRPVELPDGRTVEALTDSGGYVYAPSMMHGATAAVLLNAFLTRAGGGAEQYAVNLSSARVRLAMWLLDTVREGQPLGAALGYRFERGLHEGHAPLELDKFIDNFRVLYPLVANKGGDPGGPTESIAARNVVDGLALRRAWNENRIPWGTGGLTPTAPERAAIEDELRALDDAVDAVTDLLAAESVYQVIKGSTGGAAASLDSMAKGVRPPEPEVARVPRGGTSLSHRVGVILGGDPLPGGAWANPPRTPRGAVEPALNAWGGRLLGDPAKVICRASFPDPADETATLQRTVTLDDLELEPLDVLALARAVEANPADSELDRRVAYVVAPAAGAGAPIAIDYDLTGLAADESTFLEVLEIARTINAVLGNARPLRPLDLLPPEQESDAASADTLPAELNTRAAAAQTALDGAITALQTALAAIDAAPEGTDPDLADLRDALRAASLVGVASAFPATRLDNDAATRAPLVSQGESVLGELHRRQTAAAAAPDAVGVIKAVFGRDYTVLPRFRPANAPELGQSLATGPDLGPTPGETLAGWLAGVSRVRGPLVPWRTLGLYAGTRGASLGDVDVLQLPHRDGARWVGLPFDTPEDRPPAGRVSLVLHRPAAPSASDPWAGLLIDEWTELIPNAEEDAGVVLHYDAPAAEAPQAVLIAVPPAPAERWSLDALIRTLRQTLDMAKARAVDGELLGILGQALPMTYLAANPANDTVSTLFVGQVIAEAVILNVEEA